MKTKYKRMTKEERKGAIKDFSAKNPNVYKRYTKLSRVCTFGVVYSIIALAVDLILNDKMFFDSFNANLFLDCGVLLFCVIFLLFSKNRLDELINQMLVEDLRSKQIAKWKKEQDDLKSKVKIDYDKKETKKKTTKKKSTTKKSTKTTKKSK